MNDQNNTENTTKTIVVATKPKAGKKNSKGKTTVNKTVKNKVKAAAKTTLTRAQVAAKNNRVLGRPKGAVGSCVVNLQDLIAKLPPTSQVPVSRKWLNLLNLGISTQNIVSNTKTLTEISKSYQTSVQIQDLNLSAPIEEVLAA